MKRRSLAVRFVAIMTACALALTVVAATMSYHLARQRTEAEVVASLAGVMTAIDPTVATGVYANDHILLDELVQGVIRHPQIDAAEVIDAEGAVLALAQDAGHTPSLSPGSSRSGELLAEHGLYSPFDDKERIGSMVVHADAGYVRSAVRRQALLLAFILMGLTASLALLLNMLTLRLVVHPMSQLARQLGAMHPGSSQRIAVTSARPDEEIGTVVAATNQLLEANEQALNRERAMREEIAVMEARYRQIFDHTSAGIFLLTPRFELVNSNRQISQLIGASEADMQTLQSSDFFRTLFVDPAAARELAHTAEITGQTSSADLELLTRDGGRRWVHCLFSIRQSSDDGTAHLIEGVIYDVTKRREVESQFAYMVEHDALTGLKSRTFFHNVLRRYVERARQIHTSVTLIFIDLDRFKQVNDTHGHEAGDQVLIQCGHRLQNMLMRNSDLAARLGGDEFTIILDGVGAEEPTAQDLARRIVRSMREPIEIAPGIEVSVGASVGLASFPLHAADSEELVRAADKAMYEAKHFGRGNWCAAGGTTALAG